MDYINNPQCFTFFLLLFFFQIRLFILSFNIRMVDNSTFYFLFFIFLFLFFYRVSMIY